MPGVPYHCLLGLMSDDQLKLSHTHIWFARPLNGMVNVQSASAVYFQTKQIFSSRSHLQSCHKIRSVDQTPKTTVDNWHADVVHCQRHCTKCCMHRTCAHGVLGIDQEHSSRPAYSIRFYSSSSPASSSASSSTLFKRLRAYAVPEILFRIGFMCTGGPASRSHFPSS